MKQRNVAQLPKSVQDIIRDQQEEAGKYEQDAMEHLKKAIESASFYVDGECIPIKSGDAKSKIDQALEYLVAHVYSELGLITRNVESDAEIVSILTGEEAMIPGAEPNRDAAAKVEEYLTVQSRMKLPTSMFDVQHRYQAIPYGWKEIDIAAVVAMLISRQKVTVKYAGETIRPDDPKLPDMLRKKSEIGKTNISLHQSVSAAKMKAVKDILREYFDIMDVPDKENELASFVIDKFGEQTDHYKELYQHYLTSKRNYPDRDKVSQAMQLMADILSQRKDNIALFGRILKREDALFDSKDALLNVENFFQNQVRTFDAAARMEEELRNDLDYLSQETEANEALNKIRLITSVQGGFDYRKIPELNTLMATVKAGHDRLLAAKREELMDIVGQCMAAIHQAANSNYDARAVVDKADAYFSQKTGQIKSCQVLALLDGLVPPMLQYKDHTCGMLEALLAPPQPTKNEDGDKPMPPKPKKVIKAYQRAIVFPAKSLESEAEIDSYVEQMRRQLKQLLKGCDGIQLK